MYSLDEQHQLRHDVMGPPRLHPPSFCNAGGGLWSTADDYLRFVRMLLGEGIIDGVRVISEQSARLMRTDRLTAEQRRHDFLGAPFWIGRGFGLNLSVVTDPVKSAPLFGPGGLGTFSWPGAYGTWWQADPSADLILLYLIQNLPDMTRGCGHRGRGQYVTGETPHGTTQIRPEHVSCARALKPWSTTRPRASPDHGCCCARRCSTMPARCSSGSPVIPPSPSICCGRRIPTSRRRGG